MLEGFFVTTEGTLSINSFLPATKVFWLGSPVYAFFTVKTIFAMNHRTIVYAISVTYILKK